MISKFTSKQDIRNAASLVRCSLLEILPQEPDGQFSPEFDSRILELKKFYNSQTQKKRERNRFAAAVAALALTMTLLFSLNTEVRAAVVTWFKEVYETRIVYWFNEEKADVLPTFEISNLPEGYECIYDETITNSRNCLYQKEDIAIDGLSFRYSFIQSDAPLSVEFPDEEYTITQVTINGCPGDMYVSKDPTESHALVWVDEANGVVFTVTSFLDPDAMLHIVESVKLVK